MVVVIAGNDALRTVKAAAESLFVAACLKLSPSPTDR